jgi:integrase/recombinase XerD
MTTDVALALTPFRARPLPKRPPDDTAGLKALIAARVDELPGLPDRDPAERYGLRNLTTSWLGDMPSHNTRRGYWRYLADWIGYCDWHRLDPLATRLADVRDWLTYLEPNGPSAYNQAVAAVTAWYADLIANERHDANPARLVKRLKPSSRSLTRSLSEDELRAFTGQARARAARLHSEAALRGRAIVEIFATTAVRTGALLHGRLGPDGDLRYAGGRRVLRYLNKGGEQLDAHLVGAADIALQAYLEARAGREGVPVDELTGPLFVTTRGTALDGRDIGNLVHDTASDAGIPNPHEVVPHSLRFSVLEILDRHGFDLTDLKNLAGHANVRTTEYYTRRQHSRGITDTMASLLADPFLAPEPEPGPAQRGRPDLRVVR